MAFRFPFSNMCSIFALLSAMSLTLCVTALRGEARENCASPNRPVQVIRAVEPDTPAMAQQQGISGTVQVVVSLDATSRVTGTRVQSSPSSVLNSAALSAARQSQFQTEIRDCKPIAADYIFSVDFTAEEGAKNRGNEQSPAAPGQSPSPSPSPEGLSPSERCAGSPSNWSRGDCLLDYTDYAGARAAWVRSLHDEDSRNADHLWALAELEQKLGLRADSRRHVRIAAFYTISFDCVQSEFSVYAIAKRSLGKWPDLRTSEEKRRCALYRAAMPNEAKRVARADAQAQRLFWDQASPSQRNVIRAHGGSRDHNAFAQPCHVQEYDSAAYHSEVWWYGGCSTGNYATAYRFVNGQLVSRYSP
jgi:TonB family protein